MTALQQKKRRKIVFISPLFQGGAALAFAALVLVGAALFSLFAVRDVRLALWDTALSAHFRFQSAYEIVRAPLVRDLAWLFAGTLVAGIALYFLAVRVIRIRTERIAATFRVSGEGDLSTPTDVHGPGEFPVLGKQVDAARRQTLELIDRIRAEVDFMRKESLSEEEFLKRWEGVKERIGRIAP